MKKRYFGFNWMRIGIYTSFSLLKEKTGTYVVKFIDDNAGVLYVGATTNLSRRLNGHTVLRRLKRNSVLSDKIEILFIHRHSLKKAKETEDLLIWKMKPALNVFGTANWKGKINGSVCSFNKELAIQSIITNLGTSFKKG